MVEMCRPSVERRRIQIPKSKTSVNNEELEGEGDEELTLPALPKGEGSKDEGSKATTPKFRVPRNSE